jgi:hypothetical protein
MPSKWNPDSGRTSGKSNPRRAMGTQNYAQNRQRQMGQQQNLQGALGNAQRPAGPPMGMQSIQPPGGPVGPMGPPPMGGMGMGDPMQRMAVQRAAGVFDKPGMNAPPPMPQFQRPDMSQFQRGSIGQPPGPIGPPPGAIPPITGGPMPAPPGGGGSMYGGRPMPTFPQRPMMPGMGSIQPPQMGGPPQMGVNPDLQMGMQRRAAGLAGGMQRPGMM